MMFLWVFLGPWDFSCVAVKGGALCDFVLVQREVRLVLDAWIDAQQDEAPVLFPTRSGDCCHAVRR
jgi:hypothetical protein